MKDLFHLVDLSGKGYVDLKDLSKFLNRTGIHLTDHKLLEIATNIIGKVQSEESIILTSQEFSSFMAIIMD